MVVHAAPKTHPGGVHGALVKLAYQIEVGPSFINQPPSARPPKFTIRKNKTRNVIFFITDAWLYSYS